MSLSPPPRPDRTTGRPGAARRSARSDRPTLHFRPTRPYRSALRLPAALLLLAAPLACSGGGGAPQVAVPTPQGKAVDHCRELADRLPGTVDGQERRETEPVSALTAGWGDPAVELRCGVPRPEVLTPGSEHYNPTTDAVSVNGVDWMYEDLDDGARFTTTQRTAFVEVTVPDAYAPEVNALTDLAEAVAAAVPGTL
ncbi:DUF3515 domain-containing protein [Streptomyces sp. WMMC500]|uniref:DUF3515 domain-containing protein n=1 Tax=Streptomyces sp. WMMC500 TaxID=3015154 RepID=UPI00248AD9D3|nr:DUF3515 domain-containing protein [Streptomyces sp. WMMC500]WBB64439.1 DUF3515 domain-containing protein [Streptomyces sp. WMMC500]